MAVGSPVGEFVVGANDGLKVGTALLGISEVGFSVVGEFVGLSVAPEDRYAVRTTSFGFNEEAGPYSTTNVPTSSPLASVTDTREPLATLKEP